MLSYSTRSRIYDLPLSLSLSYRVKTLQAPDALAAAASAAACFFFCIFLT